MAPKRMKRKEADLKVAAASWEAELRQDLQR